MDKWIAKKIGDMVEDKVKGVLGMDDEEEKKDEKEDGFFSKIFNRDDDDDDDRHRRREKEKDDEKDGFFSKIFNRDDDDDKDKEKKTGFAGLFTEQEGAMAAGGYEGETVGGGGGGGEGGGIQGQSVGVNDDDLFNDLMDVAAETSQGE